MFPVAHISSSDDSQLISISGCASGVGILASGAFFAFADNLALVVIGFVSLEVEFLAVLLMGVSSAAHGSKLSADLQGWKSNGVASKKVL